MKFAAGVALLVLESAAIIAACSLNPQPIPPGDTTTSADGASGPIGPVGSGGKDATPTPTVDAAVFLDAASPPPGRTSDAGNLDGGGAGDSSVKSEGGPVEGGGTSETGSADAAALEEGVPSEGALQE